HHSPSRSSRLRRRVRDRPAAQHRRSPRNRKTGASGGGQNRAEQHPIPIHPSGSSSPPRSIQDKLLIAISKSRKSRRNSVRHPGNAGLEHFLIRNEPCHYTRDELHCTVVKFFQRPSRRALNRQ